MRKKYNESKHEINKDDSNKCEKIIKTKALLSLLLVKENKDRQRVCNEFYNYFNNIGPNWRKILKTL